MKTNYTSNEMFVGADPENINWRIVRGDTSRLKIEFLQQDETTAYDVTGWTYRSKAYDPKTQESYTINVDAFENSITLLIPSETTSLWGTGKRGTVANLPFDVEVTMDDGTIWTPVVGRIFVLADVTTVPAY